jgi:hypothetical protein
LISRVISRLSVIIAAVQHGIKAEAEKRFASARIAAFRAPELTSVVGKNQVLEALDRRWKEAKSQLGWRRISGPQWFVRDETEDAQFLLP